MPEGLLIVCRFVSMRTLILLFAAALLAGSCHGQSSKAVKDQQDAYKVLEDMKAKGLNPTTEGGWTMTADIDGKPWKATGIYNLAMSDRITAIYKDSKISLPVPALEVGYKSKFGDGNAVDFSPVGDANFWGGRSGEMLVTKVGGGWLEGTFFFTAKLRGTDKKMEVTNGFFRVSSKTR